MRLKRLFVQGETRSSAFSLLHCVALEGPETLFSSENLGQKWLLPTSEAYPSLARRDCQMMI